MHYTGNIIRPPSEANSIILQVTHGCSHNKCTFCGTYKGVLFQLKDARLIDEDLAFAARYCLRQKRVFLADGDVLVLPQKKLVDLFRKIRDKLPWVNRISLYGNEKAIRKKNLPEFLELKGLGLDRVFMGVESGHNPTLRFIQKGADAEAMIKAGRKVRDAGLFLSVTVLLGIGGVKNSQSHAEATAHVLSAMGPNQIGVLTLMLLPNTRLFKQQATGEFTLPDPAMLLMELRTMVDMIQVDRVQFQSNHASNYLPINARLPKDREKILASIESALAGAVQLVPEHARAL